MGVVSVAILSILHIRTLIVDTLHSLDLGHTDGQTSVGAMVVLSQPNHTQHAHTLTQQLCITIRITTTYTIRLLSVGSTAIHMSCRDSNCGSCALPPCGVLSNPLSKGP